VEPAARICKSHRKAADREVSPWDALQVLFGPRRQQKKQLEGAIAHTARAIDEVIERLASIERAGVMAATSVTSQVTLAISRPSRFLVFAPGSRMARTERPRSISCRTTALPINPDAPVTATSAIV
jgi:hypothetical protein